ncbi:MAG: hypothetical protein WCF80_19080, partial [Pseudolabrys sp.]
MIAAHPFPMPSIVWERGFFHVRSSSADQVALRCICRGFHAARETDGIILVIAHTTKDGLNYRGASSQGGAVDGLIESQSDLKSKEIKLFCRGFKDADQFEPFAVRCEPELIETEDGQQEVLAVKERIQGTSADEILNERPTETEAHGRALVRVMLEHFFEKGAPRVDLEEHCKTALKMSPSTFERGRKYATQNKDWLNGGGGRNLRYRLNPSGSRRAAVLAGGNVPNTSSLSLPSLPPLRGVEVSESDSSLSVEASWKRVGSDSDQDATT